MVDRFWLRFESGSRSGEKFAVAAPGLTVGRKPENACAIPDSSISGTHAELRLENGHVVLRDLGSTNGTRVGSDRVTEQRLAHGDVIRFGSVKAVFLDAEIESPDEAAPAAPAAAPDAAGGGVRTIGADRLASARKRSRIALVVLVLALAAGGFVAWQRLGGGAERGLRARPVVAVEGNLLPEDFSFEERAGAAWTPTENAPAALGAGSSWSSSGTSGYGADLAAGEWARSASPEVRCRAGRTLVVGASAWADGGEARLGLSFSASAGDRPSAVVWSAPLVDLEGEPVELRAAVPTGFDRARVLLRAAAPGAPAQGEEPGRAVASVGFDDVAVVAADGGGPDAKLAEYELFLAGEPPVSGVLQRIDRPALSSIAVATRAAGAPQSGLGVAPLAAQAAEKGMKLTVGSAPGERVLVVLVPTELASQGIATTGAGGYARRGVAFEDPSVDGILVGADVSLIRLGFGAGLRAEGRPTEGGFLLEVDLGELDEVELQLAFQDERAEAMRLAASARDADRERRLGQAIATWTTLLDRYPYESVRVREAEDRRARLVQQGLAEVRDVRRQEEEALFFELVDLHRECRAKARALAARYAGSEVEQAAHELVAEIDVELARLEGAGGREHAQRLAAIRSVLEQSGAQALAAHVQSYVQSDVEGAGGAVPADAPADATAGAPREGGQE